MRTSKYHFGCGALAIFLVAAFLMLTLPTLHMHSDEELSYRATNGSLIDTIQWQTSLQDNQAPLWFVLFNTWRHTVGNSEFGARVMGILLVMPALALVYQIARRGYHNHWAGVFSILALTGNHLFFNYALDIRPYPLVMLVAAFSVWAFQNWLLVANRRTTILYGVALAGLLYTHYLLIFFILAQALYFLFTYRLTRKRVAQGVMGVLIGAILWLPWFPVFISHVGHLRRVETLSGTSRGVAGIGVSTLATSGESVLQLVNAATNGLWWLYGAILLLGIFAYSRKRAGLHPYGLALTWAILTPILYLVANLAAAVYAPRFVSHALLGLSLAVGGVIAQMPAFWKRLPLRLIAICGFIALNLITFSSQPTIPPRVPIRDVFTSLSIAARPDDSLFFRVGGEGDGFVNFLAQQYLDPILLDRITSDVDAAREARRIWFITADGFNADVQAQFAALEPFYPVQRVLGQCDRSWCYLAQLMEAPPLTEGVLFGETLRFRGVDVDAVDNTEIRARIWWQADAPMPLDYSVGVHLLNINGELVAQHDGAIYHYGQETVQTSVMTPGRLYIDWVTLPIFGLPLGEYTLQIVVYQAWDGVRLIPDTADGTLYAETIIER